MSQLLFRRGMLWQVAKGPWANFTGEPADGDFNAKICLKWGDPTRLQDRSHWPSDLGYGVTATHDESENDAFMYGILAGYWCFKASRNDNETDQQPHPRDLTVLSCCSAPNLVLTQTQAHKWCCPPSQKHSDADSLVCCSRCRSQSMPCSSTPWLSCF